MLHDVHLHGALGNEFGRKYSFDVETVGEVVAALRANFPKFTAAIRDGFYKVILGKTKAQGLTLREDQMGRVKLAGRPVHIVPVVGGRKRGGLGEIVSGIALIGLSMLGPAAMMGAPLMGTTTGALFGQMGLAMALTGVASMLAPEQEAGDDQKSYAMTGPQSNMREGHILPICYGELVTGGSLISGGIEINGPHANEAPPIVRLADMINSGLSLHQSQGSHR